MLLPHAHYARCYATYVDAASDAFVDAVFDIATLPPLMPYDATLLFRLMLLPRADVAAITPILMPLITTLFAAYTCFFVAAAATYGALRCRLLLPFFVALPALAVFATILRLLPPCRCRRLLLSSCAFLMPC